MKKKALYWFIAAVMLAAYGICGDMERRDQVAVEEFRTEYYAQVETVVLPVSSDINVNGRGVDR